VRAGEEFLSLAAVLDRAQAVWGESVGMVDVIASYPKAFKLDARGAIPWVLYGIVNGNLMELVARSLAEFKIKRSHQNLYQPTSLNWLQFPKHYLRMVTHDNI
jgi:hypothetical protein